MYNKLQIEEFGRHLVASGDLDPIYTALVRIDTDENQLKRWLIAYWCFYHAGVASWISEFTGDSFWSVMLIAATNEITTPVFGKWPRGKERRHFRGDLATSTVTTLSRMYPKPEEMVDFIHPGYSPLDYREVSKRVQIHRGFGPWMAFKVADMLERVLGYPINFDTSAVMMFDDPKKAAWMLWEERMAPLYPKGTVFKEPAVLNGVVDYLINEFSDLKPPPTNNRPINIQEVETVLCKWKSHKNGHYPLNNDIDELRHSIKPWANICKTAKLFEGSI